MNGNVFECYEEQSDRRQYAKTLEVLDGYVRKTLKYSEDLAPLFADTMAVPMVDMPDDLDDDAGLTMKMIFAEEVKTYVKRNHTLKSNLATVYAVIWGQCSDDMKAKVKTHDDYKDKTANNDCFWLLKQIKSITLQFDQSRNGFIALLDAQTSFLNCRQLQGQSAEDYVECLRGWAETIEYHGGTVAANYKLVPFQDQDGNGRSTEERKEIARERTLAIALIRSADPTRYGTLITDLSNQYAMGIDQYPTDLLSAQSLLVNYRTPTNTSVRTDTPRSQPTGSPEASAMTFAQRGEIAGNNGVLHDGIVCYNCQSLGHYAGDCPDRQGSTTSGTTLTQYAYMLAQTGDPGIDPKWILLDSQSTISVFKNADMLSNIRRSPYVLRALTNGGYQDSNMVGDFPNLGKVWYNRESIANILSLAEVRKVCRITMDSADEPAMFVHRLDGTVMKFLEHPSGLYVFSCNNDTNDNVTGYTMLSTVAEQKKLFSRREIQSANAARDLYRKIGRPAEAEFQSILRNNLIRNCPVTPDDAKRALIIYGPDIAVIKGKTTRSRAAPRAPTFVAEPIPAPILEHHHNVTLCADFFFVQGLPFFHTISRGIGFRTVDLVPDRTKTTILRKIRSAVRLYHLRGLQVCDVHADSELECVREDLQPIALNIVPADSHVGEVERSIRTIKERLRSCAHGLPFKRLPRVLINHMVIDAVRCLNQFPWANGISDTMSPACIVTGAANPEYNQMRIEFGTYVQVFEDNDPSNTLQARSLGAIALTPTGNAQGDYYFMSLATGNKISRHNWTELPMTDTAIARVEALAAHEGQPPIQARGLVVEWRTDHHIDNDEYDRDYEPAAHQPIDDFNPADFDAIDDHEVADLLHDGPHPTVLDDAPPVEPNPGDPNTIDVDDVALVYDDYIQNEHNNENQGAHLEQGAPMEETATIEEANQEAGSDNDYEVADQGALAGEHGPHNPRQRRVATSEQFKQAIDAPHSNKSYFPPRQLVQRGFRTTMPYADDNTNKRIFGYVMNQMTAKAGIKKHGKAAEAALMREFAQLEELDVYEPVSANSLTREQRTGALRAINLIKEKRDGRLKGRTVADGRPQRSLYDKSQTASPTVSTDALMLSIMIDAHEGRDVATADVAGAYLKADMDDFVVMKFTGESVDILCNMNPEHTNFVSNEKGNKVLYVRLVKAIYGCVKSALLWYDLFHNTLKEMGFVLNPYDSCIANCTINGKQCTIAWYVDDNKISHVDPDVVTSIIEKIEERFDKMTVTRGTEHIFLGMHIHYTGKGTAVITMKEYLKEALSESGMAITREVATPAQKCLFEVDEESPFLSQNEAEIFHSVVAKLLYVSIRARADLLLAVSFLCTRVSKSTKQDQQKLRRVLEYINGSMDVEYTIGADDMGKMRSWVDAAFAVHPDMKSHTGGVMSFGTGGIICKSTKQKLNTKSSTEAEFVGASDYLPNTLWVKMFLEAQGYKIQESFFEQDNESAIKLEKNGRISAGPKSRHINIRYFWIKDRSVDEGITIRHCPTLEMLGDFFTKPLQGNLFRTFRNVLLGAAHVDTLTASSLATAEERVGKIRADCHRTGVKGIVDTREYSTTVKTVQPLPRVTWADVVKGTTQGKAIRGQEKMLKCSVSNKSVSRPLSRNNPVSKVKV